MTHTNLAYIIFEPSKMKLKSDPKIKLVDQSVYVKSRPVKLAYAFIFCVGGQIIRKRSFLGAERLFNLDGRKSKKFMSLSR